MDRVEITYTDAAGKKRGVVRAFTEDLAYGEDENDFEIRTGEETYLILHGFAYIDGTEWGGVVDGFGIDTTGDTPENVWTGRTWHGILSRSVVMPEGDHYTMTGDAHSAINALLERQGLQQYFYAPGKAGVELSYQVARFADAWTALRGALASIGMRPEMVRADGIVRIKAVPTVEITESATGTVSINTRPVNHLVCAGGGEMEERVIVHLYMDESGDVSQTQSLFGLDEITELYSYTNADADKMIEDGTEKLKDYYTDRASADLSTPEIGGLHVGDTFTMRNKAGFRISAPVSKEVVTVSSDEAPDVSYTLGDVIAISIGGQNA